MNTAKAIAVTQSLIDENGNRISNYDPAMGVSPHMAIDKFVAYVARVSNPSNQSNTLTATKLLRYLAKHKHWSPFEMVNVVMEIETTRDIARQILRHRSFSFQEFSQRYADPTQSLGFVTREARLQDQKNRQNSIEIDDVMIDVEVAIDSETGELIYEKRSLKSEWLNIQTDLTEAVQTAYNFATTHDIAKEQARAVLPEGLTVSRMYMNGTLRSWIHYCQLRMGPETQKEHREVATDAWYQITEIFPSLKDCLDLGEK
jgi:thymidylate synthase (FAD)